MKLNHFACLTSVIFLLYNCSTTSKKQELLSNKVTWFSIPAEDVNKTTQFYQQAFGWKLEPLTREEDDDYSYHVMLTTESDENYISRQSGAINGCIVKKKIGLPSPAVLVEVDNLDRSIERVLRAGGKVLTDKKVMKSLNGTFVLIEDIDGNCVEVFENGVN